MRKEEMEREKVLKRKRRHHRVRAKIYGTPERPRLAVFRSAKHIYAQFIDDENRRSLGGVSDIKFKSQNEKRKVGKGKIEVAKRVGKAAAELAMKLKIKSVVFDRGGFKYHGRVKALAEAAREAGIRF